MRKMRRLTTSRFCCILLPVVSCLFVLACSPIHTGLAMQGEVQAEGKAPHNPSAREDRNMTKKIDIDLDEHSAIQIAEVVLVRIYGNRVLGQRPWKVTRDGDVFNIWGTVKTEKGGAAFIRIRKSNAEVLEVKHWK
jgi:hypothetical protein